MNSTLPHSEGSACSFIAFLRQPHGYSHHQQAKIGKQEKKMFYSHWLLSKKGPLATIWVAAHCHKRLRKDQVKQTDISSSVDTILHHEVPKVAYRILGYLLLGVVRIFSKKVEFLFHDCRDTLDKLCDFMGGGRANECVEALRKSYHSIILPERFELDVFDLDVLDEQDFSRDNVRPREEIMLADALREGIGCSNDKYYHGEGTPFFDAYTSSHTPIRDVCSPCFMSIDLDVMSSCDLINLKSSLEKPYGDGFFLEDRLEPMMFGDTEKESFFGIASDEGHETGGAQIKHPAAGINCEEATELVRLFEREQGTTKLSGVGLSLENCLESSTVSPSEGCQTEGEQIKHDSSRINLEVPQELARSFDNVQNMEEEQMRTPEMTSSGVQMKEKLLLSINIDATLESKFPGHSGAVSPEFIGVRTPATKEHARVLRKRKCLFDETVVIPNKVLKRWINDSSYLISKRGKAPVTAHRKFYLPQGFMEPLIPCNSLDFRPLICKSTLKTTEPVESAAIPLNQSSAESPVPIAPATPVTNSTSLRVNQVRGISRPDILEPASSSESRENESNPYQDLGFILMDEEPNSSTGDNPEKYECSVRARRVATYLHKNFLNQRKQKREGTLNLSLVLERKSKRESARLFYEILALKTGDYVDVQQDNAYADILVLETPKLEQIVHAEGVSLGP